MHWKTLSLTPDANNLHDYSSLLQSLLHQLLPVGDLPVQGEQSAALQTHNLKKQRWMLFGKDVCWSPGTQSPDPLCQRHGHCFQSGGG